MSKPFLSWSELLSSSWNMYLKEWNAAIGIASWLAIIPLAGLIVVYAIHQFASADVLENVLVVTDLAELVAGILVVIRLNQLLLARDRETMAPPPAAQPPAKRIILGYLWINLLAGIAVLGGLIVFAFPGIWLSIALSFASLIFLEDGARGVEALAASARLVTGRWWKTLGYLVGSTIVFTLPFTLLFGMIVFLLTLFGGDLMNQVTQLQDAQTVMTPALAIASAVDTFLQSLMHMLLIPLLLIAQVKIFHALKKTS